MFSYILQGSIEYLQFARQCKEMGLHFAEKQKEGGSGDENTNIVSIAIPVPANKFRIASLPGRISRRVSGNFTIGGIQQFLGISPSFGLCGGYTMFSYFVHSTYTPVGIWVT